MSFVEFTGQDTLAINTDLKSVTNSELLNLAISFQKSHYFGIFQFRLHLTGANLIQTSPNFEHIFFR